MLLKFVVVTLLFVAGFILLYLIMAFGLSRISVNNDRKPASDFTIYLLSNGVHVDIVVPVKTSVIDWSTLVKYENTTGNDTTAQWVGMGWGDKGFYLQTPTWDDLTFGVAFRAVTGLSTSAMHTTFYKRMVESEKCIRIQITSVEYQKLCDFIIAGFEKSDSGDVIHIKTDANYGTNDAFYEAMGSYHLFSTCNTWTNKALKTAGLKTCLWTPFESGLLYHYRGK